MDSGSSGREYKFVGLVSPLNGLALFFHNRSLRNREWPSVIPNSCNLWNG